LVEVRHYRGSEGHPYHRWCRSAGQIFFSSPSCGTAAWRIFKSRRGHPRRGRVAPMEENRRTT
jgi:hypothetical protein